MAQVIRNGRPKYVPRRPKQIWLTADGKPVPKEHVKGAVPQEVLDA